MNVNKIIGKITTAVDGAVRAKHCPTPDDIAAIGGIRKSLNVTNPLKPLEHDCVDFAEVLKFEKNLELDFSKRPISVKIDGKTQNWTEYIGSQAGSQDAFWAKNNETGELFYIKYAETEEKEGHIASEALASKLYRLAGFDTPEISPIILDDGVKAFASKFVPNLTRLEGGKALRKGFAADAWLANWDSLLHGNTLMKDGKPVKIDNGGSLRYRAQGKIKPNFGDKVDELVTLVDGRNFDSTCVYAKMTHDELVESFKAVCDIPDKEIIKTVEDKELAQILINRKNYMKDVLAQMQETPKTDERLSDYFASISTRLANKNLFNSEVILEKLSAKLNTKISTNPQFITMPSSKTLAKDLVLEIKQLENNGAKVSKKDVVKLLEELVSDGLEMKSDKIRTHFSSACAMEEQYNSMFTGLLNIAAKTEPKDGELMSAYLTRVIKIREHRVKQLDNYRIKSIKEKLTYLPEHEKPAKTVLTQSQRRKAIAELEAARKKDLILDIHTIPKLSENATDKQIYRAWQRGHMGAFEFSDNELQKSVMGIGGRYSSKQPIKTKTIYEAIADKDYKQEFEIEPVYHWFSMPNAEDFVKKQLPKKGEIYTIDQRQCCSTHKHYAEVDFGDHMKNQNIKFIIHPKSETSRAYNLGYNQEVVYPKGEQFRILDKECVEYIDPKDGSACMRWEVHMQEV